MAYVRRLPSGLWQATVRHPSGKRISRTDPLKRVVADWARDEENRYARGDLRDPRAGRMPFEVWLAQWVAARVVEPATEAKNEVHRRLYIVPAWAGWPLNTITRLDVQAWVQRLVKQHVGAHTVQASFYHFAAAMGDAVRQGLIAVTPCESISLPTTAAKAPAYFTHEQAAAIIEKVDQRYRVLVDLDMHVGLRWGELAGLHGRDVDAVRCELHVVRVATRYGLRDYPKSKRSRRVVPVPSRLIDALTVAADAPVFAAPRGGVLVEERFRRRVWYPAIAAAGAPKFPPHTMRHTAATWLVQAGVDLYRVQQLLGHESFRTTQMYAHHVPDSAGAIREAWERLDAPLTHDAEVIDLAGARRSL